jgi:hypothetical protein
MLLGAQCLGVEKFTLNVHQPAQSAAPDGSGKPGPRKEVVPAPWAPWSLLSTGAVVCLYSFSIPSRLKG